MNKTINHIDPYAKSIRLEKSKKNYREFKPGNLKFELFNLISSPKKNVRKNEDGGDKYIVYAGLSHCSVLTYYAEYNVSISHFISFYRERLSDNAVLIVSGICIKKYVFWWWCLGTLPQFLP